MHRILAVWRIACVAPSGCKDWQCPVRLPSEVTCAEDRLAERVVDDSDSSLPTTKTQNGHRAIRSRERIWWLQGNVTGTHVSPKPFPHRLEIHHDRILCASYRDERVFKAARIPIADLGNEGALSFFSERLLILKAAWVSQGLTADGQHVNRGPRIALNRLWQRTNDPRQCIFTDRFLGGKDRV